jgi:hypothetical protein
MMEIPSIVNSDILRRCRSVASARAFNARTMLQEALRLFDHHANCSLTVGLVDDGMDLGIVLGPRDLRDGRGERFVF